MLSLMNLDVFYGDAQALWDVSMEVHEGEIVTLLGSNGAGKSTTLRTVSGLVRVAAGEIWYDGQRIDGLSPQVIVAKGIAHVPEGRQIFGGMRVKENLLMGAYLQKDPGKIENELERIYTHFPILKERSNQAGGKLSGGEQQMLAIGRALMARPKLLLLDEPSLGLSPRMVQQIGKAIMEINQNRNVSIILVEQNARLAFKTSQRGYVLELGQVVLEDSSNNLMQNDQVKKIYLGEKDRKNT